MHSVAVVCFPDMIAYDLSIAVEAFSRVPMPNGENGYRVLVCGTDQTIPAGPISIVVDRDLMGVDRRAWDG